MSLSTLVTASSALLFTRIGGLVVQVSVFVLVVRLLPKESVGVYAVLNATWMIYRDLGGLGLGETALRITPELIENGRELEAGFIERKARNAVLRTALFVAVIVGLAALVFALNNEPRWAVVILSFGLGAPAFSLVGLQSAQLRARGHTYAAQIPESLIYHLVTLVLIMGAWLLNVDQLAGVLLAHLVSIWLVCGIYWHRVSQFPLPGPEYLVDSNIWGEVKAISGRMFVTIGAGATAARLPQLLAASILGPAAAATMETAMRFGLLPGFLTTWAVSHSVSPLMAAAQATDQRERLQSLFTIASWLAFLPALAIFLLLAAGGRIIIEFLVGPEYLDAYVPMIIVALSLVINASFGLAGNLFMMTGFERIPMRFTAFRALIVLTFGAILGHHFGIVGITVAVLIGAITRDVGMSIFLPERLGLHTGVWSSRAIRSLPALMKELLHERRKRD